MESRAGRGVEEGGLPSGLQVLPMELSKTMDFKWSRRVAGFQKKGAPSASRQSIPVLPFVRSLKPML